MSSKHTARLAVVLGLLWASVPVSAQPLGTFRWQIQPYCNVLTLTVVQQGGNFTLDGTDDRCGLSRLASAAGIAYFNPNGTVSFGLTEVMPGGLAIHMDATIDVSSLSGTWRDSGGSLGTLVFTPGAGIGGPLRSVPSAGVAAGSITAVQLANGAVGAPAVAANAITGSNVVDGSLTHADLGDAPKVWTLENSGSVVLPAGDDVVVANITIATPAAGRVIVNASGSFEFGGAMTGEDAALCSLTTGTVATRPFAAFAAAWTPHIYNDVPFGGTRAFTVAAGSSTTFRLVCLAYGAGTNVSVDSPVLTALFVAGS